jgi:hypothetical protein
VRVWVQDGTPPPGFVPVEASLEDAYMTLVGAPPSVAAVSGGPAPAPQAHVEAVS